LFPPSLLPPPPHMWIGRFSPMPFGFFSSPWKYDPFSFRADTRLYGPGVPSFLFLLFPADTWRWQENAISFVIFPSLRLEKLIRAPSFPFFPFVLIKRNALRRSPFGISPSSHSAAEWQMQLFCSLFLSWIGASEYKPIRTLFSLFPVLAFPLRFRKDN